MEIRWSQPTSGAGVIGRTRGTKSPRSSSVYRSAPSGRRGDLAQRLAEHRDVGQVGLPVGADAHRTGEPVAHAGADVGVELADLVLGEPEQPAHVRVRAEAAAAGADRVLVGEPGGQQPVRHALEVEGRDRQPVTGHRAEPVQAGHGGQLGVQPAEQVLLVRGAPSDQPSLRSSSAEAVRATTPMTLGEPASSRSGPSAQMTSSKETARTAPPPTRNGSPVGEQRLRRDERAGAERARTSCGRRRR